MRFEWFITKRIARSKQLAFSRMIVRIATVAIALSMAVMIITSALVSGFQQTISDKIYGFMGHLQISRINALSEGNNYEEAPVSGEQSFYPGLEDEAGIRKVQHFARKAGIIKSDDNIEGIIIRGINTDFDREAFQRFLVEGEMLQISDTSASEGLMISTATRRRMGFELGENVVVYFIDQSEQGTFRQRARRFTITGIYNTGIEEFDKLFALADIEHIRQINRWSSDEVGGFEVFLDPGKISRPADLDRWVQMVDEEIGPFLEVRSIRQLEPNIFDWLSLQNQNERLVLSLMMIVAIINMITSLLILILERTKMIGVMRSLGAGANSIRRIFLLHAMFIIGNGLLWGNLLGIGLSLAQQQFGLIQLPEASYYVTTAPIALDWGRILVLNLMTMAICTMALWLPSALIVRIDPIKALRFD